MRNIYIGILFLVLFSCGTKEEVLLPKTDKTIVKEVSDWSAIYMFFRQKDNDTLCEINRRNSIGTTNWILHIDRRLPLRLMIPEVMRLQQKRHEGSIHQNEKGQNYYSYADTIGKNLAFLPFTQLKYKLQKPKQGIIIYFSKRNLVNVNGVEVDKAALGSVLRKLAVDKHEEIQLCFDKNMSYGSYIDYKVLLASLNVQLFKKEEAVY